MSTTTIRVAARTGRVPGLVQITWQIVQTKKMRGHEGEKFEQKGRKIEN